MVGPGQPYWRFRSEVPTKPQLPLQYLVSGISSAPSKGSKLILQRKVFDGLSFEHVHMLTTLPRKRADDPTSTPLACTLTAAIPAALALLEAVGFKDWHITFALSFNEAVPIVLFVGCLAWFLTERRHVQETGTASEYLANLMKERIQ